MIMLSSVPHDWRLLANPEFPRIVSKPMGFATNRERFPEWEAVFCFSFAGNQLKQEQSNFPLTAVVDTHSRQ